MRKFWIAGLALAIIILLAEGIYYFYTASRAKVVAPSTSPAENVDFINANAFLDRIAESGANPSKSFDRAQIEVVSTGVFQTIEPVEKVINGKQYTYALGFIDTEDSSVRFYLTDGEYATLQMNPDIRPGRHVRIRITQNLLLTPATAQVSIEEI